MRLIDADALIDEIKHITGQDTIMWFYDRRIKREQEVNMAAFIELMPTIDPVKHGEWYITEDMPYFGHIQEYLTCSACEGRFHGTGVEEWDYCPNCGAKMDGGEG